MPTGREGASTLLPVGTAKRERQKAGRQARLAQEQKVEKRKKSTRRFVTIGIVVVLALGGLLLLAHNSNKSNSASSTTSTSTTNATKSPGAPAGGSGNKTLAAMTTSADCPSNFSATLNKPSYTAAPHMTIDSSKTYTAVVTTDKGPFTITLDAQKAPRTVNNFVFLAQHHFYDCVIFHRVIQNFMNQTGDPTGTGTGGPGYQFADELPATATPQYPLGSVAMANSGPNTNGSQFFIVAGSDGESLPPSYSLFGKVTSGQDVVAAINSGGAPSGDSAGKPVTVHRIVSITVTPS